MLHEIAKSALWAFILKAYDWVRSEFIPNKRRSVPVLVGFTFIVLSAVVPASSSAFLWWFENWGTYIGAALIVYGIYPLFANLADDDEPRAPPHR
ncbi:MAG: hypothetical protein ACR2PS_12400 [Pseudomonadales bacterium]